MKGRPQLEAQEPSASCVRGGTKEPSFPMAGCLAFPTPPKIPVSSPLAHAQLLFGAVDAGAGKRTWCSTSTLMWRAGSLPGGFLSAGCSLSLSFSPLLPLFFSTPVPPSAGVGLPGRGRLGAGGMSVLPSGIGARRWNWGRCCHTGACHLHFASLATALSCLLVGERQMLNVKCCCSL